jgi:hypothetical protein
LIVTLEGGDVNPVRLVQVEAYEPDTRELAVRMSAIDMYRDEKIRRRASRRR